MRPGHRQGALPRSRRPREHHDPGAGARTLRLGRTSAFPQFAQPRQLPCPSREATDLRGQLAGGGRVAASGDRRPVPRPEQQRVVPQYPFVGPLEVGRGVDAELLAQPPSDVLVAGHRVRPATEPVQGDQEVRGHPFPERMLVQQADEFRGDQSLPAEFQVGCDPLLDEVEAELLDGVGHRAEHALVGEVAQARSPPQLERLAEQPGPPVRPRGVVGVGTGRRRQVTSAHQVDQGAVHLDPVAGGLGADVGRGIPAEGRQLPAQPRDVAVQDGARARGWGVSPQHLRDALGGDHGAPVQQQQREDTPHRPAPERHRPPVHGDLDRTEQEETRSWLPAGGVVAVQHRLVASIAAFGRTDPLPRLDSTT